jgi:hypothetical protein
MLAAIGGLLPVFVACTGTEDEIETNTEDVVEASEAPAVDEATAMDESTASLEQASTSSSSGIKLTSVSVFDWFDKLKLILKLSGCDDHKDLIVKVSAKAIAEARCTNPGGHQPPGQNPVFRPISVSGFAKLSASEIKSGSAKVVVVTTAPPKEIPGAPDCPNPKWKETIVAVRFTSFKLSFEQKDRPTSGSECSCKEPTKDGWVPEKDVSCK